jgi:hypothetical protein
METLPMPCRMTPFLPDSWLQTCLHETAEETGQEVDPRADIMDRGQPQNWIAPPCWGWNWPNRAEAEDHPSYSLLKKALTTLHEVAISLHLTTPTNLVDRKPKYHSQASHLVRPHQRFHLNTNTKMWHLRNNSRTFINRLNWTRFLNLYFFYCVSFSFFLFLILFLLLYY